MEFEHFLSHIAFPLSFLLNVFLFLHILKLKEPNIRLVSIKKTVEPHPTIPVWKINLLSEFKIPTTEAELKIFEAGFRVTKGPDAYSLTIYNPMLGNINACLAVAHYWPKSKWWNLIGKKGQGRGLEKMLEALK